MKNNLHTEIGWLLKEKYNSQITAKVKKDIERLKKGEPVDYVIGFKDFLGAKIDLSKKPLIPRVETEFWVQKAIEDIRKTKLKKIKILDIFAGSGCVGLAAKSHIKNSEVIFADKFKYFNDKNFIKSDIFKNLNLKKYKNYFNFILANPPYIPIINKNKVGKSTIKYEPKQALFGGKDGLFYIRKFLKQAKNYLAENGKIYMEFDSSQKNIIRKILKKYGYNSWLFYKDQFGKWRWVEIKM